VSSLVLIVALAGQKVALRACDVQSVVEIEVLTPVPCAPLHVAGLSALRSRVLTVIDPQSALGLGPCPNRIAGAQAAVVVHEGHAYALLLDNVEDVTEARSDPAPVQGHFRGDWARMSYGMVETDQAPLLLLDVGALISGPEETRAA
jgi:purine-binding chemotaxis protein CheW